MSDYQGDPLPNPFMCDCRTCIEENARKEAKSKGVLIDIDVENGGKILFSCTPGHIKVKINGNGAIVVDWEAL